MNELNIGHSIVARALAIGLEKSVREMKSLLHQIKFQNDNIFFRRGK